MTDRPVALVTGASSGIGEATAILLAAHGYTVYGAARRTERMDPLRTHGIKVVSLDVTDEASITAAVEAIRSAEGRIDVLVNNAGYGSYGAVEDVPLDEARRQFDVNIFGLARLIQLVLPTMREQGSGTIVNISSMGGRIYTPFGGWYHATKHALEGLTDCLRLEVRRFGINVVLIEPGAIRSEWGGIAADNLEKTSREGAYAAPAQRVAGMFRRVYSGRMVSSPDVVARAILEAVTAERPKVRYVVGVGARPALALRRFGGEALFDRVMQVTAGRS